MKRHADIAAFALLVAMAGFASASEPATVTRIAECRPPEVAAQVAPWTVLFYSNADGDAINVSDEFAEQIRSTAAAHVLMLEDPSDAGAVLWHVGGSAEEPILSALEAWGEVDMADAVTLLRFVEFARSWYPSDRLMVMLYGHGRGWKGACYDNVPAPEGIDAEWSWLTPNEMQDVFSSVGGIDALFFTAPCITAATELVYELRNAVDLVIAAEPMSSFSVWRGGLRLMHDVLVREPDVSLEDLASVLLDEIEATYDRGEIIRTYEIPSRNHHLVPHVGLTAVLKGPALAQLPVAVDAFAHALLEALEDSFSSILWRRNRSQDFGNGEVVDVYDFAEQCTHIEGLEAAARAVMQAVDEAVFAFIKDPSGHPDAHGLSLYFPMPWTGGEDAFASYHAQFGFGAYGRSYRTQGLDLMRETRWDEFLIAFYEKMLAK